MQPRSPGRTIRLTVLQSVPEPRATTNPYVVMLFEHLRSAGVEVLPFSWRTALLGRYQVFHVHWPENLVRGRGALRTLARQVLILVLLLRLRVTRRPVVRTLHNVSRHEQVSRRETWVLGLVNRWTDRGIAINSATAPPAGVPVSVIPHGHYRDWFTVDPAVHPIPGRLAYVGLIRAYKGVESLLAAFRELNGPGLTLTVSGQPRTTELADELRRLSLGDDRIILDLSYISDAELAAKVAEAELVVLPYREMHNSGAALAALSMDRPVLVPANRVNEELAAEVGPGWVLSFSGDLTAQVIREALEILSEGERRGRPDLSGRGWSHAGERHREVYLQVLTRP